MCRRRRVSPPFQSVIGDARDLAQFQAQAFDVAFSNSVIEHVGGADDQRRMASEAMRVASHYFVQTPKHYFPIEPHFLVPGFQFMPSGLKAMRHPPDHS
ncbi:MAG: methyltransferase domain-containing protein [Candidatus Dormibacteraceae bacterium]